jgi:predicted dehydrogenase
MRFALVGNHPDGLDMAGALVDSGRHQWIAYSGPAGLPARWAGVRRVHDLEEVLADPAVEAVLVAGPLTVRAAQLRRALQSERPVLCVHPVDGTPEAAYEAAMIQQDTGSVLLPLLPEARHPALSRLAEFIDRPAADQAATGPVGAFRLLEVERTSTGEVLEGLEVVGQKPALPGWDVLRALGGEILEVSAFAEGDELMAGEPVLLAGRFEHGGLFQVTLIPAQPEARWRLAVAGTWGRAELLFPVGWQGPAFLHWRDESGEEREEWWEAWDPWPGLVEAFEAAVGAGPGRREVPEELRQAVTATPGPGRREPVPAWQDEVRALELDDAVRRSVERRRTNLLEYPEASEEVGFKGTMTLVGCGLLWGVLLLLIASVWVPRMGWLILPLLVVFVGLQFLRYLIPKGREDEGR